MTKKIRTMKYIKSLSLSMLFTYIELIKLKKRERSSLIVNNTRGMKTLVLEYLPSEGDRAPSPVELTACHKNVAMK